jgi:predicted nucleic acid-binding protein
MTVVVDASVAYKWFVAERDTIAAWAIAEGCVPVIAPELVLAGDIALAFDRLEALGAIRGAGCGDRP